LNAIHPSCFLVFTSAVQVGNAIGDAGAEAIAEGLKVNNSLLALYLVSICVLVILNKPAKGHIDSAHAFAAARQRSWKCWCLQACRVAAIKQ
jgi:hypothetical protein